MKGNYWTLQTDEAIWKYIELSEDLTNDKNMTERDLLFKNELYKPLVTLIESLINTYKLNNNKGTELDSEWLKSSCFLKLFDTLSKGYLKRERGRPFNYITSVLRFHMIQIRKDFQKQKHHIESNFFDNEEYIYNEMLEELVDYEKNNDLLIDPETMEEVNLSIFRYEKIIYYLEDDIKKNMFSSKKELIFAENLLDVMKKVQKVNWSNKFFIKWILSELCFLSGTHLKRFTINYYLLKFWKRYKSKIEKELY